MRYSCRELNVADAPRFPPRTTASSPIRDILNGLVRALPRARATAIRDAPRRPRIPTYRIHGIPLLFRERRPLGAIRDPLMGPRKRY